MTLRGAIATALSQVPTLMDSSIYAYVGSTPVLIKNADGKASFVRTVKSGDLNQLLVEITDGVEVSGSIYKVTIASTVEPDANAIYWISENKGVTKQRAQFLKKKVKGGGEYWIMFLRVA